MGANLATKALTSTIVKGDTIVIEQGGSIKRITFDNLLGSINSGDEQLLRQVAWGVPLEKSSNPAWGVVGNTALRDEWNARKGRYLVTNAGLAAKLSATNSRVYADGTTLDVTKGHIMRYAPRLYYLVKKDSYTGYNMLWMSLVPIGGNYLEERWDGAFLAYNNGGALTSRPDVVPTRTQTINTFWNQAQVNGKDFGISDYDFWRYVMMETLSDYGNPNIQTCLGYGPGGSAGNSLWSSGWTMGDTMSLGDESGYVTISGDSNHTSLHGLEDLYNGVWQFLQGIYCGSANNSAQSGTEVFILEGNRLPSSTELTSTPSGQYRQFTRLTNCSASPIQAMVLGEHFDLFPKTIGGNTSINWCDGSWSSTTEQVVLFGGLSHYGASSGVGSSTSNNTWSFSAAGYGARLAYYGNVTVVDGKQIV
jgi:hypothetical protein